jgi:hypothetical protein
LAGAIRGRARRILATIAHQYYGISEDDAGEKIEPLIKEFFGSEERKGVLRLTEAKGEAEEHIQNFIGVDRFTGGVNKGANYKARAAACEKLVAADCLLDRQLLPAGDWWKGMLLLVLLDGMDGEMQIGWGKAKGYGRMKFQLNYDGKFFGDREALLDMRVEMGERLHSEEIMPSSFRWSEAEIAGVKGLKLEGAWTSKDFTGGGAFWCYFIPDRRGNRLICLDLLAYAPGMDKMDFFRRLDAVASTFSLERPRS